MQTHRLQDTKKRGFALIELMIAVSLLMVVTGSVVMMSIRSSDAYKTARSRAEVNERARRAADRVVNLLLNTSEGRMNPVPDVLWTNFLTFQSIESTAGGAVAWTPIAQLALQYEPGEVDDGLDNNGNGLIDECQLVYTRDIIGANPLTVVLCKGVAEFLQGEVLNVDDDNGNDLDDESGFCIFKEGDLLMIRITVQDRNELGELLASTIETGVRLRN